MNKTFLSLILVALIAAPLTAFGNVASVQAASINTAVRGESQQTVYWYANDGKRYVFPNAATYFTWFTGFDNVQNISDSELFAIPLGGNVTYRPGAKLVKINTDPKVYAVARGGVLRHVTSESLASQLYGFDWPSKVQDIPVEYFANYSVGSPIYNVSDFNVSNEYNGVFNPSDSIRTQGQNGTTGQSGSLTLNADRTSITSGQAVYLTGTYFGTLPSGGYLEIKDVRNSNTIKTCYNTSTCTVTVYPTVDSSQNSVQYYIVAKNSNGTHIGTQYGPVIYTNGTSSQTGTFTLTADDTNITSGQTVNLHAYFNDTTFSGDRIDIQEVRTGSTIKTCNSTNSCWFIVYPSRLNNASNIQYKAFRYNRFGSLVQEANVTIYFDGSSQTGTVTLTADRTTATQGESITLSAHYSGTLPVGGYLKIFQPGRGSAPLATTLNTCFNNSCSYTYTFSQQSSAVLDYDFGAMIVDTNSQIIAWNSPYLKVYVHPNTSSGTDSTSNDGVNFINGLTLQSDRTSAANGDMVKLTANAYNNGNWSYVGNRIEIRDVRTGAIVKTCNDQSWCVVDVAVQGNNGTAQYETRIYDRLNRLVMSQFGPVIYVSGTTSNNASTGTYSTNSQVVPIPSNYISMLPNGGRVVIKRAGNIVATCYRDSVCSIPVDSNQNYSTSGNQLMLTVYNASSEVRYEFSLKVYFTNTQAGTTQYEANIYDNSGRFIMSHFGTVINASGTSTGSTGTGSVGTVAQIPNTDIHIAPTYNVRAGGSVYLTASFTNLPYTSTETVIRLYTEQSSTPVGTCTGSVSCSVPYTIPSGGVNTHVYGVASNSSLTNTRETARIPLYAF